MANYKANEKHNWMKLYRAMILMYTADNIYFIDSGISEREIQLRGTKSMAVSSCYYHYKHNTISLDSNSKLRKPKTYPFKTYLLLKSFAHLSPFLIIYSLSFAHWGYFLIVLNCLPQLCPLGFISGPVLNFLITFYLSFAHCD